MRTNREISRARIEKLIRRLANVNFAEGVCDAMEGDGPKLERLRTLSRLALADVLTALDDVFEWRRVEFVLIQDGKEIEFTDTGDGYSNYWFSKGPGTTYKLRLREEGQADD